METTIQEKKARRAQRRKERQERKAATTKAADSVSLREGETELVNDAEIRAQLKQYEEVIPVNDQEDQVEAERQENRITTAIQKGTRAVWELADAITICHDRKLYRFEFEDKTTSFAKWGKTKFCLSRSRLYQLLDLHRLESNVPEVSTSSGHFLTESALRPLAKLAEPKHQNRCWREIKQQAGKPEDVKPRLIRQVVENLYPSEKDELLQRPKPEEVRAWIERYLIKFREDARVEILETIKEEAAVLKLDAEQFAKDIEKMNAPLNLPPPSE